jgi:hypothetical protein
MAINKNQAYIAIRTDGFVDAACFTETAINAEDVKQWKTEMSKSGFEVKIVDRSYAKSVLFENINTFAA